MVHLCVPLLVKVLIIETICNDRELSRIEMSETSSNLQHMRSVALPNLPLLSPVLAQKNSIEYQNITKTPYLTILI